MLWTRAHDVKLLEALSMFKTSQVKEIKKYVGCKGPLTGKEIRQRQAFLEMEQGTLLLDKDSIIVGDNSVRDNVKDSITVGDSVEDSVGDSVREPLQENEPLVKDTENVVENMVENVVENTVENVVENTVENVVENTVENVVENQQVTFKSIESQIATLTSLTTAPRPLSVFSSPSVVTGTSVKTKALQFGARRFGVKARVAALDASALISTQYSRAVVKNQMNPESNQKNQKTPKKINPKTPIKRVSVKAAAMVKVNDTGPATPSLAAARRGRKVTSKARVAQSSNKIGTFVVSSQEHINIKDHDKNDDKNHDHDYDPKDKNHDHKEKENLKSPLKPTIGNTENSPFLKPTPAAIESVSVSVSDGDTATPRRSPRSTKPTIMAAVVKTGNVVCAGSPLRKVAFVWSPEPLPVESQTLAQLKPKKRKLVECPPQENEKVSMEPGKRQKVIVSRDKNVENQWDAIKVTHDADDIMIKPKMLEMERIRPQSWVDKTITRIATQVLGPCNGFS